MRDVFLTKVADLTAHRGQIETSPIPMERQVTNKVATQEDGEAMPDWNLEQQADGLYSVEIHDRADNSVINLSFAAVSTPSGKVETIGADEADTEKHLGSLLLLSESGGSGAELATGRPDTTPAAEIKIASFVQHLTA